ncbi:CAF17-like 4Fe-4S cluster assembly/insertion protein YgfZ [Basilea psittacipulmonis]|uniref:CAF17-like 4Fe-4S cluster assembly/insertion protein YgfZ n=1 Tax=Basilea psittacipulmonis TaxID=1472345 RepID=UPI0006907DC6|nr:folate-binding protein YgfZ [Basilea psittacipulmonis]
MSYTTSKTTLFAILTFQGEDASTFLQGQISQDVRTLNETELKLAAYCSPKGRLLANFWLWKDQETIYALVRADIAESVQKRLKMYILRAKVTIDIHDQIGMSFEPSEQPKLSVKKINDTYHLYFGADRHLIFPYTENTAVSKEDEFAWQKADILDGYPWITAGTQERFLAQALNFDALGGISYTKGCYTGQEIIARTHYRGQIKRGLRKAELSYESLSLGDTPLNEDGDYSDPLYLKPGQDLTFPNNEIGEIVNVCHHDGTVFVLCVVSLTPAKEAQ